MLRKYLSLPIFFCVLLSGCATRDVPSPPPRASNADLNQSNAISEYKINVGDELDLHFFYAPDLNSIVTVRPDGKINLPLIGDAQASGLTAIRLGESLKTLYAEQLRRSDVSVNVRGFASMRVFVGGEVGKAGAQPLIGDLTLLQAVTSAEGMKETADTHEIIIVRIGENNQRRSFTVDVAEAISGKDPRQDILLQPLDVVLVPRTGIANVNLWVDQYIRKNLPINFNYTINKNSGSFTY